MRISGLASTLCCVLIVTLNLTFVIGETTPCRLRATPHGGVCVCTSTYCDYIDVVYPTNDDELIITSSSKAGLRFATTNWKFSDGTVEVPDFEDLEIVNEVNPEVVLLEKGKNLKNISPKASMPTRKVEVDVDRSVEFQNIVGFGGAFTGAVAHNLEQLTQELQDAVYQSFYSSKGIAFDMMRMSIGGCDFDVEPWAYNETPEDDTELSNFTDLDPRDLLKIKQIERLKEVTGTENIRIMAAAWSPPRWMKTNNAWTGMSRLKKEYYQTWADYHLKFLEQMDANNMPVWAISTGNEPLNGVLWMFFVRFMSLGWTASSQANWLADHFGPTIRNSKFKDIKIFASDDQRYTLPFWIEMMKNARSDSMQYIDGIGIHWYWDQFVDPILVDITRKKFPDMMILSTESCMGDKPFTFHGPLFGSWDRGERYAHSFLQDLLHEYNGYIDWNIILDEQGGPNYVDNFVDAPVVVNVTSGDEIYKQPIFYAIGHFSKFIPEGSVRIQAKRSNINIVTAAFKRPDGRIATLLFNSGKASVDVTLKDSVRGHIVITIPARSLHTLVYN